MAITVIQKVWIKTVFPKYDPQATSVPLGVA